MAHLDHARRTRHVVSCRQTSLCVPPRKKLS